MNNDRRYRLFTTEAWSGASIQGPIVQPGNLSLRSYLPVAEVIGEDRPPLSAMARGLHSRLVKSPASILTNALELAYAREVA
jgi:hypothetical protein